MLSGAPSSLVLKRDALRYTASAPLATAARTALWSLMCNLAGASVAAVTSIFRAVLDAQARGELLSDASAPRSLVRAAFARGLFVRAV